MSTHEVTPRDDDRQLDRDDAPSLPGSLQWRPLTPGDLDGWLALVRRVAEEDRPDWVEQRADLEEILAASKNDPRRDTIAGFDADGELRAVGRVSVNPGSSRVLGAGAVDPGWRRRGIGRAVLAWQAWRATARVAGSDQDDGVLRNVAEENNPSHLALLTGHGGKIVRYFTEMTRPLRSPVPDLPLPAGLELVDFTDSARDVAEAVRLAHNDAFQDHWGSEPRDRESWQFTITHPEFRPDWSLALLDPGSGEVAAYQLASHDPASPELLGHSEGYTDLLGVRRAWRGRGLAPALLAEAMRRYRSAGMENAGLGVDTDNPSGALGLYERMGYTPTRRSVVFDLPLGRTARS